MPTMLPRWQCHKVVAAAKVLGLEWGADARRWTLLLQDGERVEVDDDWLARKLDGANPVGGYYVVYPQMPGEERSYASWSPGDAFEAGYARLP